MKLDSRELRAGRRKISHGFHELLEGVEESLRAARREARHEVDGPRQRLSRGAADAQHWVEDVGTSVRDTYQEAAGQARVYVREHPRTVASLVAVGAGLLVACLLLQRR
ncbi:DUF883 family protein [Verticiella sediminum]|uniref:DUF883 family protein n=1 Tax=Verticiella sediminum TaxID=1247510 RepID=A0A556AY88_9BURK|nr:DUF883 family protein [Verticiella sediminum]TSH97878.1 DUF883 family protein [Verticiella sediminum]